MVKIKTQVTVHPAKDVEQEEDCSNAGRSEYFIQPLWKSIWQILEKWVVVLRQKPAITILAIFQKNAPPSNKDTCSPLFVSSLLVIARNWKEHRYPSVNKRIKKK